MIIFRRILISGRHQAPCRITGFDVTGKGPDIDCFGHAVRVAGQNLFIFIFENIGFIGNKTNGDIGVASLYGCLDDFAFTYRVNFNAGRFAFFSRSAITPSNAS